MKITGIYEIKNEFNNKRYIGQAADMEQRFRQHKGFLRQGKHSNRYLQAAWNKHGEAAFRFRLVNICEEDKLNILEQLWFDTAKPEYNLNHNAASMRGYKHRPETLAKASAIRKGVKLGPRSPEVCAKLSAKLIGNTRGRGNKGRVVSDETRARMSKARTGLKLSPEALVNWGKWRIGKVNSAQTRAKVSASRTGTIALPAGPNGEKRWFRPEQLI